VDCNNNPGCSWKYSSCRTKSCYDLGTQTECESTTLNCKWEQNRCSIDYSNT
jgi:hypothetical protein